MDTTLFPTKGNLRLAQNTLALSNQGFDLLDKKRNILMREMMTLIDETKELQDSIGATFQTAYKSLQKANLIIGIDAVDEMSHAITEENGIGVYFRGVMGVDIPVVKYEKKELIPQYGFFRTTSALDDAYMNFTKVKELTIKLAEVENAVYRLAVNIKKTQKRANSLKNVIIPKYIQVVHQIQNVLEEKEREEFGRLKVIKRNKQ